MVDLSRKYENTPTAEQIWRIGRAAVPLVRREKGFGGGTGVPLPRLTAGVDKDVVGFIGAPAVFAGVVGPYVQGLEVLEEFDSPMQPFTNASSPDFLLCGHDVHMCVCVLGRKVRCACALLLEV